MPKGNDDLPDNTEERDLLDKVCDLAPLISVILQLLELVLKWLEMI